MSAEGPGALTASGSVDAWRSQSAVTAIGPFGAAVDGVPSTLAGIRRVSQQLVEHYMVGGDEGRGPVCGERLREVDTRFASAMFTRLMGMGDPSLNRERPFDERIAGCCRDFSVLYVAMARHKGIPARIRVGYATYFWPGWYLDHVVAEAWDGDLGRWRLVEAQIPDGFAVAGGAGPFDPLDVPRDRFLTGAQAWLAARSGKVDPERFVVTPNLDVPYTRGWLSLRHHVVQDLAALNRQEMLLWDQWGILDEDDPLSHAQMLDELAGEIADPGCPAATIAAWSAKEGLRVPGVVTSYSPAHPSPLTVEVKHGAGGRGSGLGAFS